VTGTDRRQQGLLKKILGHCSVSDACKRVAVKIIAVRIQPSRWIKSLVFAGGFQPSTSMVEAFDEFFD
jgi:hypothetical protein